MIDESGRRSHYDSGRRSRDFENRPHWVFSDGRTTDRVRLVHTSDRLRSIARSQRPRHGNDSYETVRARNAERALQAAVDNAASGDFARSADRERSLTRSYFMPSPPYSNPGIRSGTPGDARHRSSTTMPGISATNDQSGFDDDLVTINEFLQDDLAPLTRVQGRIPSPATSTSSSRRDRFAPTPAPFQEAGRRSPAMSDSSSAQDTWETLLTTVQPDEHLPSASSSFTSAEASANAARSASSVRSSQTTVPTRLGPPSSFHGDVGPPYSFQSPCDLDESDLESLPDTIPMDDRVVIETTLNGGPSPSSSSTATSDSDTDVLPEAILHFRDSRGNETSMNRTSGTIYFDNENNHVTPHGGRVYPPRSRPRQYPQPTNGFRHGLNYTTRTRTPLPSGFEGMSQRGQQLWEARHGPIPRNREYHHRSLQRPRGEDRPEPGDRLDFHRNESHQRAVQRAEQEDRQTERRTLQQLEQLNRETEYDLRSMQRLIERLAQRQDIPDDWWAAAGLERSVRESQRENGTREAAAEAEVRA